MTAAPKWARDLVLTVAIDNDRSAVPELVWRRSSRSIQSSGRASSPAKALRYTGSIKPVPLEGRIVVTAGKDRIDQKLVLLHELAHWLAEDAEENHGDAFWDRAWRLYRRYRVPLRYAQYREGVYRKGALAAAARTNRGKN